MPHSVELAPPVRWLSVLLLATLTACGGGGSGGGGSPPGSGAPPAPVPPPPPPPPPPPVIGSVEIEQTGLLLTEIGQTRQLNARVLDTNGNPMTGTVTWTATTAGSSAGAHVTVSADGLATAMSDGLAQVIAKAGNVESAPLLVAVARVADGAILLTDAQIVGEPDAPDPASPEFGVSYSVRLVNIPTPPVGALLVNTESKPVAGRVIAATAAGGESTVTLEFVPFPELLPEFAFEETIDFSNAVLELPADIAADYRTVRTTEGYQLVANTSTSKMGATTAPRPKRLECKADASLGIELPSLIQVTLNPSLDVKYGRLTGLERFVLNVDGGLDARFGFTIDGGAQASYECKWELMVINPRIGGLISFILYTDIPVGVGLSGSYKVASSALSASVGFKTSAQVQLGLDCPGGGECDIVRSFDDFEYEFDPKLEMTGGGIRIEPTVGAFFYADPEFIVTGWRSYDLFATKAGFEVSGSLASSNTQIADPLYKSSYGIAATVNISASDFLKELAEKLFGKLTTNPELASLSLNTPIGNSPSGVVKADKPTFAAGERVNFQVTLEGVDLIPLVGAPYNVHQLLLIRNDGGAGTVVARVDAAQDQKSFNMAYTSDRAGNAADYYVFVVTWVLQTDLLALEIGRAAANTLEIFHVTSVCTPVTEWVERTGFNGAQVRTFYERICSGTVPGRNLRACRYNGAWMAKHEGRSDLVYNTRNGFPGSYESDEFSVAADGTFDLRYAYGWNETRETTTHTVTNFTEARYHARGNPVTQQSGGEFYRKIDRSTVSKVPTQTGTYNVTTLEASYPFAAGPPAFGGRFSIDPPRALPVLIEARGIAEPSEIPAECSGDSPYDPP